MTIREIVNITGGEVQGDPEYNIVFPAKIEEAQPDNITFLANKKYVDFLFTTKAGCIVISKELYTNKLTGNFIVVPDAYEGFAKVLALFNINSTREISDKAFIHPTAKIGLNVHIYPFVYIGENTSIGDNCILYPNVSVNAHCSIGNNCIIHSGAVIGSDGFGFAPVENGSFHKIPQLGNVIIEDDVEIGANTCIDRATMGSTIIRKGVKLDNLIQVAHNVEIGEHTVIAAQTGISGSTQIGHHNMIGGQVGFVGHITIAPYTKINAQSAVPGDIKEPNQILSGAPAIDIKKHFRNVIVYKNLADLERRLRELENILKAGKQADA